MANLPHTLENLRSRFPDAQAITQGMLRSDVVLTATQGAVQFSFLQNQNVISAKEVRLQLMDAFCITAMKMCIYKSADTAIPLTAANVGKAIDYSYPQPAVFVKTGEAAALENLFNGYLSLTIQKSTLLYRFPAYKFRRVNVSQFGTTSAAIAGPVQYTIAAEEQAGVSNGLVALEPTINLYGSNDIQFVLQPTANADMTGTTSLNVCSLILDGYLIQGAGNQTSEAAK